jgi:hypothetical protein
VEAGACIDGENANVDNEDFDQPVYLDLGLDRETDPAVTTSPDDEPMTSSGSTTETMMSTGTTASETESTGTTAAPTTSSGTGTDTDADPSSTGSSSTAL